MNLSWKEKVTGSTIWFRHQNKNQIRRPRIALYSPGMIGLGHIRRNVAITQALTETDPPPVILLIAESREASIFVIPKGVDCITLPALRKEIDGKLSSRYLDIEFADLVRIRSRLIQTAIEEFMPDIFIVDHLARGAHGELDAALQYLRDNTQTKCVLGMRDIIGDASKVREDCANDGTFEAIQKYYNSVWVYGDRRICDVVQEYGIPRRVAAKVRYVGYLDKSWRLQRAIEENHDLYSSLELPPGRLALCFVGGGQDGARLAHAFVLADLPSDMNGVIVAGPYMGEESFSELQRFVERKPRLRLLRFIAEPILLLNRADVVIAMGGYNTVCEILSFGKRALIVPRMNKAPEQAIRAERLNRLGLVGFLPCEKLDSQLLTDWLAQTDSSQLNAREWIDLNGLERIPPLMKELLASLCHLGVEG
jgi:predicted glycosyltransferase